MSHCRRVIATGSVPLAAKFNPELVARDVSSASEGMPINFTYRVFGSTYAGGHVPEREKKEEKEKEKEKEGEKKVKKRETFDISDFGILARWPRIRRKTRYFRRERRSVLPESSHPTRDRFAHFSSPTRRAVCRRRSPSISPWRRFRLRCGILRLANGADSSTLACLEATCTP